MKFSKSKIREQGKENIVVVAVMVAILIFLFSVFGWTSIKEFIQAPLILKGQDALSVTYLATIADKNSDGDYTMYLEMENNTKKKIDDYDICFEVEGAKIDYPSYSYGDISAFGITKIKFKLTTSDYFAFSETKITEKTAEKLMNADPTDIDLSCKIKTLKSDGKKIVNNTGLFKDILIVLLSLGFGVIGFFGPIENKWLRIILKLLSLFAIVIAIVIIVALAAIVYLESPEGKAAVEESKRKDAEMKKARAASDYKSAAHVKAAAAARGDYRAAAYAQEKMDKSMADMIGGGENASKYKSAAHVKAAATVRGDRRGAAYAQAEMDKQIAEIIKKK